MADRSWGRGPTIILVHGLGRSSSSWAGLAERLADRFRCIAVDLPGFGASQKPDKAPYTLDWQAIQLARYLRGLRSPVHGIVGHSFGGGVVLRMLARGTAGDVAGQPEKTVLIGCVAFAQDVPRFLLPLTWPLIGRLLALHSPASVMAKRAARAIYFDDALITPEVLRSYEADVATRSQRHVISSTLMGLLREARASEMPDLATIARHVSLIWGAEDVVIPPAQAALLHATLPKSDLTLIPGVGHAPQEEDPSRAAEAVLSALCDDHDARENETWNN